jgi:hypothetical protein
MAFDLRCPDPAGHGAHQPGLRLAVLSLVPGPAMAPPHRVHPRGRPARGVAPEAPLGQGSPTERQGGRIQECIL